MNPNKPAAAPQPVASGSLVVVQAHLHLDRFEGSSSGIVIDEPFGQESLAVTESTFTQWLRESLTCRKP